MTRVGGQRGLFDPVIEQRAGRDEIERLARIRSILVAVAQAVARELALLHGRTSSPEVFAVLHERGWSASLDAVDPRWAGAIFRRSGWEKDYGGPEVLASHGRIAQSWRLRSLTT